MEIKHQVKIKTGEFVATESGEKVGRVDYIVPSDSPEVMIITHVKVNEAFQGKGLAKKLVLGAVEYARENKLKIEPICPYAKSMLTRGSEYEDVLSSRSRGAKSEDKPTP